MKERSIGSGANAKTLALIELQVKGTGKNAFGAGIHDNIVTSSIGNDYCMYQSFN